MTQYLSKNEQILSCIFQKIFNHASETEKELKAFSKDLEVKNIFYAFSKLAVSFLYSTNNIPYQFSDIYNQNSLRFSLDFDNDLKNNYRSLYSKYMSADQTYKEIESDFNTFKKLIKICKNELPEVFEFIKSKLINFESNYIKTFSAEELDFYNYYFKSENTKFANKSITPYHNNSAIFTLKTQISYIIKHFDIGENKYLSAELKNQADINDIVDLPVVIQIAHDRHYKNKIDYINNILKAINRYLTRRDEISKELTTKFANVPEVKEKVNSYFDLMENYKMILIKIRSKLSSFANLTSLFEE